MIRKEQIDRMFSPPDASGRVAVHPGGPSRPGHLIEGVEAISLRHSLYLARIVPWFLFPPLLGLVLLAPNLFEAALARFGLPGTLAVAALLGTSIGGAWFLPVALLSVALHGKPRVP